MLEELDINEATLYKNLNGIRKWDGIKIKKHKIERKFICDLCDETGFIFGKACPNCKGKGYTRKMTFEQEYWWISK